MTTPLHRLLVTLDDVEPPVQRDLVVPSGLPLDRLHRVLQAAMGWEDSHLHQFVIGAGPDATRYGIPDQEWADFGMPIQPESRATVAQLAPTPGSRFTYIYDYGDDWRHTVEVIALLQAPTLPEDGGEGIHCISAHGACPPEDCGGPPGYENLREALANPKHPEHRPTKDWLGRPFDPDSVDLDAINTALAQLFKPRRSAPAKRARGARRRS